MTELPIMHPTGPRARQRLYRLLTIKEVFRGPEYIKLSFEESAVGLQCNRQCLREWFGIQTGDLTKGRTLLVRGRVGNDDMKLWREDAIAEMYLFREAPEPKPVESTKVVSE